MDKLQRTKNLCLNRLYEQIFKQHPMTDMFMDATSVIDYANEVGDSGELIFRSTKGQTSGSSIKLKILRTPYLKLVNGYRLTLNICDRETNSDKQIISYEYKNERGVDQVMISSVDIIEGQEAFKQYFQAYTTPRYSGVSGEYYNFPNQELDGTDGRYLHKYRQAFNLIDFKEINAIFEGNDYVSRTINQFKNCFQMMKDDMFSELDIDKNM